MNTFTPQDAAEYHASKAKEPCFTASIAHTILTRSALHAWYECPALNPDYVEKEDGKLDYGSAAHDLLLEGGDKIVALDYDDWRKKAAKEARDEARAAGKIPVLARQYDTIQRMVIAATQYMADSELGAGFLANGFIEHAMTWREGTLLCKGRPDVLQAPERKIILDYKSTSNAEPDAFLRLAYAMSYHLQGAHYQRGNAATGGAERAKVIWLVQEVDAPYACSLVGMSPSLEELAHTQLTYAMALWQSALERKEFSGYPGRVAWVDAPAWAIAKEEQRHMEESE